MRVESLIVSLTTIKSRLPTLEQTLGSLLRQSLAPDQIVVNLSEEAYLLDAGISPNDIPRSLIDMVRGTSIVLKWTRNIGSYRKLVPTLALMRGVECVIVIADDDVVYPERWLAGLYDEFQRSQCIVSYRCRAIRLAAGGFEPYRMWPVLLREGDGEEDAPKGLSLCPTGKGGVLYHSGFFPDSDTLEELRLIAPMQDDLAFRFATLAAEIPVRPISFKRAGSDTFEFPVVAGEMTNRLWHLNRSRNDKALIDLLAYYSKTRSLPIELLLEECKVRRY